MFWYEKKRSLEISCVRAGEIREQIKLMDAIGRNQLRLTYKPAYYLEWQFDDPNVYRQNTQVSFHTERCRYWRFLSLMHDNVKTTSYSSTWKEYAWNGTNIAYGQASMLSLFKFDGAHWNDALQLDKCLRWLSRTWILQILKSGGESLQSFINKIIISIENRCLIFTVNGLCMRAEVCKVYS